ncbi:hypothetical protein AK830_g10006 [Neonectria ditissima]|uniref:Uncharacterized protein n=1 Tax=Neonectria ditissima TaxID=78410 RepID=A0A0P7B7T8_9HYPO|nr:hypothetical protein AK830_g10006 [Neonectria ditissima]
MPKRYLDVGPMNPSMNPDALRRKTQRSHEQNQERAYVAASRRADRSIEARVQSARMASQVHKARTGKALRVSEEIVMKDEMYEEEDDGFPRSYHMLGPHLQTASPTDMNSRVDAYLKSRVTMAQMVNTTDKDWRDNDINRQFAQCFPSADQNISERWTTPRFSIPSPRQTDHQQQQQQPVHYAQRHSLSSVSSNDGTLSPSALSPSAVTPESASSSPATPQMPSAPVFELTMAPGASMNYNSDGSVFTAELPLEAKMLMTGFDQRDAFDPVVYSHQWGTALSGSFEAPKCSNEQDLDPHGFCLDNFDAMNWDPVAHPNNSADELSWNTFINDSAWSNDQQSATDRAFS